MFKLYVIGIGYKPFTPVISNIVKASDMIVASGRLLDIFIQYDIYESVKEKLRVINNVDETFEFIKSRISNLKSHIVLLASGDPLFFGIGRRSIREFGREAVEIIPDISSVQLAFSKIKESWDDALLLSLHGGSDPLKRRHLPYDISDIPNLLKTHKKIAILTDSINNPSKIAETVHSSGLGGLCRMFVCEKLGYPDEKIKEVTPFEFINLSFVQPNLVVLLNQSLQDITEAQTPAQGYAEHSYNDAHLIGLSEKDILHSGGLITKDEARAITLHKLRPLPFGVFWDIGAGSGSISVEISRLCPQMNVFAVEKDPIQTANILNNKMRFNLANLHVIEGEAPFVLKELPTPHRVFIGGSGGRLEDIVRFICETRTEIIVINAATIETLNKAFAFLQKSTYDIDVVQVSVSRLKRIGDGNHFSAHNPVFIIRGIRV